MKCLKEKSRKLHIGIESLCVPNSDLEKNKAKPELGVHIFFNISNQDLIELKENKSITWSQLKKYVKNRI